VSRHGKTPVMSEFCDMKFNISKRGENKLYFGAKMVAVAQKPATQDAFAEARWCSSHFEKNEIKGKVYKRIFFP
jgi:hypothetical protein